MTSSQCASTAAATLFPIRSPPLTVESLRLQPLRRRFGPSRLKLRPRLSVSFPCARASSVINEEPSASASGNGESWMSLEDVAGMKLVGSRIRVRVPLKVHHVPKLGEIEITGREGVIKDYVAIWKGKRISANFPFKVEFQGDSDKGPAKFFAHLRDDEFDIID